jgi:superfamily II DNA or RNA helicase
MTPPVKVVDSVRKAAASGVWSQGVRLARQPNAVVVERRSETEVELRVAAPAHPVPLSVTIYFGDVEWTCDCGGTIDPCAHVVAAAIFLEAGAAALPHEPPEATPATATQVRSLRPTAWELEATPATATGAVTPFDAPPKSVVAPRQTRRKLGYRLSQESFVLWLTRVLVAPDGSETPLREALTAPAARALVMEIAPREQDLHLDRLMGSAAGRYRVSATLMAVVTVLEGATDVRLGARPVRVSKEPVMPLVTLRDVGSEFELRFERDPAIDEVLGAGLARLGDELRPLGETERTGFRLERLPLTRRFSLSQAGDLVNSVLPELDKTLVVEIKTDRLPGRVRTLEPRVEFELTTEGEVLLARANIVYGTPTLARLVEGRLVQLGDMAPKRMFDAEKRLELALRDELDLLLARPLRLEGLDAARFVDRLERWRRAHASTRIGEAGARTVQLVAALAIEDFAPEIQFHSSEDGAVRVAADVVWRARLEGIERVPLSDGSWGILPEGWLSKHADLLEDYLAARATSGDPQRAVRTLLGTSCDDDTLQRPEGFENYRERLAAVGMPELPGDLTATLRPYQLQGVRWLSALRDAQIGGILADDMGLGKTLQTICVLRGRSLVVVPKSVLYNWSEELTRFRPGLRVSMYHGVGRVLDPEADVTLTSYAVMRLDQAAFAQVKWDAIVLDEAQTIKNVASQVTEAAFALPAKYRLALTGTPIENRLEELWSEMQFVNPGVLGSLSSFRQRFVEPILAGDSSSAERLRHRVRPFVLRRLKSEVAPDLPARSEDVLWVELEPHERELYEAILSDSRRTVLPGLAGSSGVFQALEVLLRLRQSACHLGLLPGRNDDNSSKIARLFESLQEVLAEGHKAIVFSQWTSLLDKVEPELAARGTTWVRLDGATVDRAGVVKQFQDPAGPPLLLASLKAGGTGLNLTAADHVYLLDPWWNPAAEAQAADRAHRIGRERPVFIHRLIARDTVEERVLQLQERKRALGGFVDGADPTAAISREEIAELLR